MSTNGNPVEGLDLAGLDATEMARAVGEADEEQLEAALGSELRGPILDEVFRRFPEFVDPQRTRGVNDGIEWLIGNGGEPDRYLVAIEDGTSRAGRDLEEVEPRVTLELGAVDFLRLVTGNANVPVMFVTGRLRVRGDAAFAADIASFFRIPGHDCPANTEIDPEVVDAGEMARAIGSASDRDLEEGMRSPLRDLVLEEIFRRFPDYIDTAKTKGVRAAIKFKIGGRPDGGDDRFLVLIDDGTCTTGRDLDVDPRTTLAMDGVVFLKLVTGNCNPTMTFMTGKLRVHGDLLFAAQLAGFFRIPSAAAA